MPAILCWGFRKPDRPPPPIERLGDLRAALARPEARLLKTHVAPTQKRKGGISYEVNGRTVAPATVAQALTLGRLRPHDPDLLGDDDNAQSWTWGPRHE
jgi:hypothetical protein